MLYTKNDILDLSIDTLSSNAIRNVPYPKPDDLRISTRTCLARFTDNKKEKDTPILLNVEYIYWFIPLTNKILGIKYGKDLKKGTCRDDMGTGRFGKGDKINLCSLKMGINQSNINMKIFHNGSIHLTGCQSSKDGIIACNIVCTEINRHYYKWTMKHRDNNHCLPLIYDGILTVCNFHLSSVNCTYKVNFEIHQDRLNTILQKKYGLQSNYEPCSSRNGYQGVNTKYMWNEENNNGICCCIKDPIILTKKRKRKKPMPCKCTRISIMTFRTGKITLISRSNPHPTISEDAKLYRVYDFLNNVFKTHYYEICRFDLLQYLRHNTKLYKIRYWNKQKNKLIQVLNLRVYRQKKLIYS